MTNKIFSKIKQDLGLSSRELGELLGVTRQTVSKYANGTLSVPERVAAIMSDLSGKAKVADNSATKAPVAKIDIKSHKVRVVTQYSVCANNLVPASNNLREMNQQINELDIPAAMRLAGRIYEAARIVEEVQAELLVLDSKALKNIKLVQA